MWNVAKARTHAIPVLYSRVNRVYFHDPVSRETAASVAIQGKYSSTNTMKASAEACVKGGSPVILEVS